MEIELEELHLAILLITAVVILYSDHEGFAYFREKKLTLSKQFVAWSHRLVWAGLLGMLLTGVVLVFPSWEYWLQDPAFYVKMGFVLTLFINAFFIGKLSHVATETPFSLLEQHERQTLLVSGALSAIGWIGAACMGFFVL